MHSILLIGQSNMAGRGAIGEAPILQNADRIKVARNCKWVNFFRPVNPDRSFSGVCLAERFADLYIQEHDVEVGLIPCADGGTSIAQWQPGEVLFENAVNCAKLCEKTSTLVAILWHQGEAECKIDKFEGYYKSLDTVMTELKKRIGKNVPIVLGGLGDYLKKYFPEKPDSYLKINTQLEKYANNHTDVAFASAKDLVDKGDNLHFNTSSLMEFGKRYYQAFKTIENLDLIKSQKEIEFHMTELEKL